jgi:hypothetical protein
MKGDKAPKRNAVFDDKKEKSPSASPAPGISSVLDFSENKMRGPNQSSETFEGQ